MIAANGNARSQCPAMHCKIIPCDLEGAFPVPPSRCAPIGPRCQLTLRFGATSGIHRQFADSRMRRQHVERVQHRPLPELLVTGRWKFSGIVGHEHPPNECRSDTRNLSDCSHQRPHSLDIPTRQAVERLRPQTAGKRPHPYFVFAQ